MSDKKYAANKLDLSFHEIEFIFNCLRFYRGNIDGLIDTEKVNLIDKISSKISIYLNEIEELKMHIQEVKVYEKPKHPGEVCLSLLSSFNHGFMEKEKAIVFLRENTSFGRMFLEKFIDCKYNLDNLLSYELARIFPNTGITFWNGLQIEYDSYMRYKENLNTPNESCAPPITLSSMYGPTHPISTLNLENSIDKVYRLVDSGVRRGAIYFEVKDVKGGVRIDFETVKYDK